MKRRVARRQVVAPTSISLLDRLRVASPDAPVWKQFEAIYSPLIRRWLGRIPGLNGEIDDLAQEVMLILVRELPRFERQREGSFRSWLRIMTANRVRTFWRKRRRIPSVGRQVDQTAGFLERMTDSGSDLAKQLDREHDQHILDSLLATIRPDFSQETWDAFLQFGLEGRPASDVARELNLTENAVIKAKSRVLIRLRKEAGGFLE
jgi:RNA polymerase sigma-70 factor (ECF subfamily)